MTDNREAAQRLQAQAAEMCRGVGVQVMTVEEFEKWMRRMPYVKHLSSGSNSKCLHLKSRNMDLVLKELLVLKQEGVEAAAGRFLREVQYMCRVKGLRGLVQMVSVCPVRNIHIAEYAGDTLDHVVRGTITSAPREYSQVWAYEVAIQLLEAHLMLVSCGILHNDLKKNNICVV